VVEGDGQKAELCVSRQLERLRRALGDGAAPEILGSRATARSGLRPDRAEAAARHHMVRARQNLLQMILGSNAPS